MNKFLSAFLFAALPAAAAAQGAPQRIGAAGAVTGLVSATAPGAGAARVIKSGSPLFLNDRVTTDAKGKLQVMLLDETVFTVGPGSDMVLDEFVYDPSNDAGKVSVKVAKGAFRFVTGKVARKEPANMKVKLAAGTIGIRGTMFYVNAQGPDAPIREQTTQGSIHIVHMDLGDGQPQQQPFTVILLGPGAGNNANELGGAISVSNLYNNTVVISQPGFGVTLQPGIPDLRVTDMSQQLPLLTAGVAPEPAQGGGQGGETAPAGEGAQPQAPAQEGVPVTDVSEEAGQTTASAGTTLADAAGLGDLTQPLDQTSNQASIDAITENPPVSGVSTWEELNNLPSRGVMLYSGSGLCALSGSAAGDYTGSLDLEVDFGARTYGGGRSSLALTDQYSSPFDSTVIFTTPFEASGDAAITLNNSGQTPNVESANFVGSQITFNTVDGNAAANATVNLSYSNPGMNTSGSGQFTATPMPLPQ